MRLALTVALGVICAWSHAELITTLSGLNSREEVDLFCSHVRQCMAEPVREPRTEGDGAMRVRFYGHPSLETDPQVAANKNRAGLRYCNWAPYHLLMLDLHNTEPETVELVLFCRSGAAEFTQSVVLPPGRWTTAEVAVSGLRDAGLDPAAVDALGLRLPNAVRSRPARIVVDNVRLVGADEERIAQAREAEDELNRRRPPAGRVRTEAAEMVVRPQEALGTVSRRVQAPVIAAPEVLVVGGGLAGVAAAVTAARMGADVLLVERSGALGGMATTGLVPPAFSRGLTRGIVEEFCVRLKEAGGEAEMWNPEIMKYVLLDMMQQSGARLMLYSLAVGAIVEDGAVRGILVEGKAGPQAIRANIIIDATGDADVAAWAGAPFEIGRGRDEETQTQTLVFLLGNVDTRKLLPAWKTLPDLAKEARAKGDLTTPFAGGAAIQEVVAGEHGVVNINSINVPQVSGLKVEDLTYAHVEAHREAVKLVDFYRKYVPGCQDCYLLQTAEFIGVRESRRIVGEYTLSAEEVLCGAEFRDAIARGFYPVDIHAADGTGDAAGARLSRHYEIPYRCLVPLGVENLLVAGRPISVDHVAHGSTRVMGTTMPIGEAAGAAAALCLKKGRTPRELPGHQVRRALRSLQAWPTVGSQVADNLALATRGTVATADSIYSEARNYTPGAAIDGLVTDDQRSRWLSGDNPPPHWLRLDFAEPVSFRRVRLHLYAHAASADLGQYVPRSFEVQVPEGEGWRTVASVEENTQVRALVEFEPVRAGSLRVLFTTSCPADHIVRLREIEVH